MTLSYLSRHIVATATTNVRPGTVVAVVGPTTPDGRVWCDVNAGAAWLPISGLVPLPEVLEEGREAARRLGAEWAADPLANERPEAPVDEESAVDDDTFLALSRLERETGVGVRGLTRAYWQGFNDAMAKGQAQAQDGE